VQTLHLAHDPVTRERGRRGARRGEGPAAPLEREEARFRAFTDYEGFLSVAPFIRPFKIVSPFDVIPLLFALQIIQIPSSSSSEKIWVATIFVFLDEMVDPDK
jgi:hypothetical protein